MLEINISKNDFTLFEKDMIELSNKEKITNSNRNKNYSLYSRTKIHSFVDNYIIFDLETTGYSPKDSEILEISAIKYDNNKLIDTFNYLIKPCNEIPDRITKLTGITEHEVSASENIEKIFPLFLDFIKNYTLIAYNGSFDFAFIEYYINKFNYKMIDNPNIDVLYLAREYIDGTSNYKLETLKKHFNLEYSSHRALSDCYTTNYIYQYCKNNLPLTNKTLHTSFSYKKYSAPSNIDIINRYKSLFTDNPFLNNKNIAITGEMKNFNRNELIELLTFSNTIICNSIIKKTNLLITGFHENLTSKQKRAQELIKKGQNIRIIDEDTLLDELKKGASK